jgi:hypothetical protein
VTDKSIHYRSGYKYQLASDYHIATRIRPLKPIDEPFIALDTGGNLTVKSGYAWDGTSGRCSTPTGTCGPHWTP